MRRTVKLGEACLVRRGTTITKKNTTEGNVPVIGGGTKPTYFHNESNREANCITISGSGASAGFVNKWDVPIFASDCSTVEPKDSVQLHQFVYYYLLSQQQFIYENFRSGAAQPHVYAKDIGTLDFPILSLVEQQRIVAKLDSAFAEIDRAIEAYQQSLIRSDSCLAEQKRGRLEQVLQSAHLAKLGDIAELKNGLNYNKGEKGNLIKILGVGDFKDRFRISTESLQTIETNAPVKDEYLLEQGDIIFVRSNGNKQLIGRSVIVEKADERTTFSGFCIRCRVKNETLSSEFLCHFLKSAAIRNKLVEGGGGANISNLNQKMLSDINVPLISFSEQQAYINWVEEIELYFDSLTLTLQQRLQLYAKLKSAILSQELQPSQSEAA